MKICPHAIRMIEGLNSLKKVSCKTPNKSPISQRFNIDVYE